MINNLLDNDENIKDKLLKLSLREIRLEAKRLSINLYSRKTKKELVELLSNLCLSTYFFWDFFSLFKT